MTNRKRWTREDEAVLRAQYERGDHDAIAAALGVTTNAMRQHARKLGLRKAVDAYKKRMLTAAEQDLLRQRYPHQSTASVAALLGVTVEQCYAFANRMGLKKTAEYLDSPDACRLRRGDNVGARYRFTKGHVPANKGKPFNAGGRSVETRFKKGRPAHEAHNYVPIGSLKIDRDGYLIRKVTDDPRLAPVRRWVGVHRLVWEQAHGPIPAGHVVVFKGPRTNVLEEITPDRLECISKAEHARRNHPRNKSPELGRLVQLKGQITRQVNRITREAKEATP